MKLFNNHSGSRNLPRFIKGIYWATALFLRTPFTEGCAGANKKASPLGVIRNRRLNSVALLRVVPVRSVQFSSGCAVLYLSGPLLERVPVHAPQYRAHTFILKHAFAYFENRKSATMA